MIIGPRLKCLINQVLPSKSSLCVSSTVCIWPPLQHQQPPPEQERYQKSFTWGSRSDPCPEEQFNLTDRKKIEFLNHHFLKSYENVVRLWLCGYIFARIARMPWINVRHSCSRSCFKICLYNGLPQDEVRPMQTLQAVPMPSRLVLAKRRTDVCSQYFLLFYSKFKLMKDSFFIIHFSFYTPRFYYEFLCVFPWCVCACVCVWFTITYVE